MARVMVYMPGEPAYEADINSIEEAEELAGTTLSPLWPEDGILFLLNPDTTEPNRIDENGVAYHGPLIVAGNHGWEELDDLTDEEIWFFEDFLHEDDPYDAPLTNEDEDPGDDNWDEADGYSHIRVMNEEDFYEEYFRKRL